MAVLTGNVQRPVRLPVGGIRTAEVKLAGYTNFDTGSKNNEVWSGSIVIQDVSDTDGYSRAAPASASINAASGDFFMGLALEHVLVDSGSTADGSKKVTVARDGVWGFPVGSHCPDRHWRAGLHQRRRPDHHGHRTAPTGGSATSKISMPPMCG
jgi:hypothetical protein